MTSIRSASSGRTWLSAQLTGSCGLVEAQPPVADDLGGAGEVLGQLGGNGDQGGPGAEQGGSLAGLLGDDRVDGAEQPYRGAAQGGRFDEGAVPPVAG